MLLIWPHFKRPYDKHLITDTRFHSGRANSFRLRHSINPSHSPLSRRPLSLLSSRARMEVRQADDDMYLVPKLRRAIADGHLQVLLRAASRRPIGSVGALTGQIARYCATPLHVGSACAMCPVMPGCVPKDLPPSALRWPLPAQRTEAESRREICQEVLQARRSRRGASAISESHHFSLIRSSRQERTSVVAVGEK